jgi:hypothetical protein
MTKSARAARINARLEPELQAKVDFLRRRTKLSATEIIKVSIDQYYQSVKRGGERGKKAMLLRDFVGCGAADANLSTTYKRALADTLAKKT